MFSRRFVCPTTWSPGLALYLAQATTQQGERGACWGARNGLETSSRYLDAKNATDATNGQRIAENGWVQRPDRNWLTWSTGGKKQFIIVNGGVIRDDDELLAEMIIWIREEVQRKRFRESRTRAIDTEHIRARFVNMDMETYHTGCNAEDSHTEKREAAPKEEARGAEATPTAKASGPGTADTSALRLNQIKTL